MKLHLRNVLPERKAIYNAVTFFQQFFFLNGELENVPEVMYDIQK